MKYTLAINYGSSTLKYALFGDLKRLEGGTLKMGDVQQILLSILKTFKRIDLTVHRVVHGMDLDSPMLIDGASFEVLKKLVAFDPLHNAFALTGIELCMKELPNVPHYVVFDTSFFKVLPITSKAYAVPFSLFEEGIKRYGFHGISYSYLLKEASKLLRKSISSVNLIMLHLGSGASICAVQSGKPVDTSMGMTPLEGLVMSTRAGDLDPGVVLHLLRKGKSLEEVERMIYKEWGIKGMTGISDMRQVIEEYTRGNESAKLAIDLYVYRIKKYIGAYYAVLPKLDALVFSGGVGENSPLVRKLVCRGLEKLGIIIDERINQKEQLPLCISRRDSEVKVLVIRTDEELEMVRQLRRALKG